MGIRCLGRTIRTWACVALRVVMGIARLRLVRTVEGDICSGGRAGILGVRY
jgi:hypothetical protein